MDPGAHDALPGVPDTLPGMGSRALDPAVFGDSADAVWAVAADGTVTLWNRAAEELFGYPAHEILGRPCWTVVRGCDASGQAVCLPQCETRKKVRRGETPQRFAVESRARDGRTLHLDIAIIAARAADAGEGTVVHIGRNDSAAWEEREYWRCRERALRRAHGALRASRECHEAVARGSDGRELLDGACRVLVDVGGYRLVWVALREGDGRRVRPVAHAGLEARDLSALAAAWDRGGRRRGPAAQVLELRQPFVARDVARDPLLASGREDAVRLGYASFCALPLVRGQVVVGVLGVAAAEPEAFEEEELQLLTGLAHDLGRSLESVEQRAARGAAEADTAG